MNIKRMTIKTKLGGIIIIHFRRKRGMIIG